MDRIWAVQFVDGTVDTYLTEQSPPCDVYVPERELNQLHKENTELKERVGKLGKKLNEKTISYGEISAVLTPAANRPDLGCRVQAKMLVERAASAEAKLKLIEQQHEIMRLALGKIHF